MSDGQVNLYRAGDAEPVVYATEELARYLRMMDDVDVEIQGFGERRPWACAGIRLGLLSDFGIEQHSVAKLDDRIYVDVSALEGIVAGSNPRSVLLAAYRFLEEVGCRWVRPGKDGEYVPRRDLAQLAVQLDETPSYRYRGMCIEGAVSYENVEDSIDWAPKVGLNSYFLEFIVPYTFFDRWYRHLNNPYKEPEGLTVEKVVDFRQRLEREIKKRGLLYHAVGHGWTCEPFGIEGLGWDSEEYPVSNQVSPYLAEVDGRRAIYKGIPLNTQLCYSNADARQAVVDFALRTVQEKDNIDVLHVWLADGVNNHCECPDCRDTLPSDYYVQLLNEIDAAFTQHGIDVKIAFVVYVDLLWAPQRARFNNPDRFVLLFAPISRSYSEPYDLELSGVELPEYERNQLRFPSDIRENLAHLKAWQQTFHGDAFTYEYYFMWDHYFDPAYYEAAKVIHADVQKLARAGLNGIISDQTQRAFFPTGFGMYVLAKSLWDDRVSFTALAKAYFAAAFGPDGEACRKYMARLSKLFDPPYLRGDSVSGLQGEKKMRSISAARKLGTIPEQISAFEPVIERNLESDQACWNKSWGYLSYHATIATMLALAFKARAEGKPRQARDRWGEVADFVQRHEDAVQPALDVFEFVRTLDPLFR